MIKGRTWIWAIVMILLMSAPLAVAGDNSQEPLDNPTITESIYEDQSLIVPEEDPTSPEGEYEDTSFMVPEEYNTISEAVYEEIPMVGTKPEGQYFTVAFSDLEFLGYSPLQVYEQIQNGSFQGEVVIEQLNNLYNPGIEITAVEAVDDTWSSISEETSFILGDILVNEDFSDIGIFMGKDQVYSLSDQSYQMPAEFVYYNQAFHIKTIQEVW